MIVALTLIIAAAIAVAGAVAILAARGLAAAADHRALLELALEAEQLRVAELQAELDGSAFRQLLNHTVRASIDGGGVIEGVLFGVYDDAFVIRHPMFVAGTRPAGIGDEVTIARAHAPLLTRVFDGQAED